MAEKQIYFDGFAKPLTCRVPTQRAYKQKVMLCDLLKVVAIVLHIMGICRTYVG